MSTIVTFIGYQVNHLTNHNEHWHFISHQLWFYSFRSFCQFLNEVNMAWDLDIVNVCKNLGIRWLLSLDTGSQENILKLIIIYTIQFWISSIRAVVDYFENNIVMQNVNYSLREFSSTFKWTEKYLVALLFPTTYTCTQTHNV